jgi:predicted RNA-binding protein with RPS1 domain
MGDVVRVKLLSTDRQGKMKLSMKQVDAPIAANDSIIEIETPENITVIN